MAREIRTKNIKIRLYESELREFKSRAGGQQVARYIRELVLKQKIVKHIPRSDPKLIFAVAKIGANLNQIARVLNYSKKSEADFDIIKCLVELNSIKQKLDEIIEFQQKLEN
jgi:hypothetical protein